MRVKTLTDLAIALQVSQNTVTRWRNNWSGFPKQKKGGWDPEEVRAWHLASLGERADIKRKNMKKAGRAGGRPVGPDREVPKFEDVESLRLADDEAKWKAAYRKAKAMREMLELQKARGAVVDRDEVESMFAARVHEITSRLDALGRTLAPQLEGLSPREIEARINEHTRAIRIHFARATPIENIGQGRRQRR